MLGVDGLRESCLLDFGPWIVTTCPFGPLTSGELHRLDACSSLFRGREKVVCPLHGSILPLRAWTCDFLLSKGSPSGRVGASGPDAAATPAPRRSGVAICNNQISRRLLLNDEVPCSLPAATSKRSFS